MIFVTYCYIVCYVDLFVVGTSTSMNFQGGRHEDALFMRHGCCLHIRCRNFIKNSCSFVLICGFFIEYSVLNRFLDKLELTISGHKKSVLLSVNFLFFMLVFWIKEL